MLCCSHTGLALVHSIWCIWPLSHGIGAPWAFAHVPMLELEHADHALDRTVLYFS
jgi:hypothetical protein